ncbi:MAG: BCD family MFS transporter [Rhodocyclaceae bacterium]|jgi:BCD family chlorophyll transporter-like MFS transporter|nr:BCD family MFS transporter [Rhodocyclaceae bacterium]MCA3144692.1 BCD family MFS transporter [Rhodocyclaceae bacterium]
MRLPRFSTVVRRIPFEYLPFADAASEGLPLSRLLRLSLFQVTVGMATALLVGTLNRVMIVELMVPAWVVALMVGLPLLAAPFRALTGFRSDTHRSAFGWRRVPFIWTGTLLQFCGLAIMPFALLVLSGQGQVPTPPWFGQAAAGLAFLTVGIGLQTAQTAGLALATDKADDATRPRVVALMYVMLLAGMLGSSFLFSLLLAEFTPQRLIQVVQGAAVITMVVNSVALWKQEARDPARAAALRGAPAPAFRDAWRRFLSNGRARRYLWAVGLGTAAFNMQDVILEPYGGEILHLSVGATSALTALMACGALAGFALSARLLGRGMDALRLAAWGAVAGLPAFSAVVFAAPLESALAFRVGATGIGFGGGLFAVGTLSAAMRMEERAFVGLALGAWGAVQATAAGLSVAGGGALRDLASTLARSGDLGVALANPVTGYNVVYHLEMLLLFVTLVAIGPLVGRRSSGASTAPRRFGLADLPG